MHKASAAAPQGLRCRTALPVCENARSRKAECRPAKRSTGVVRNIFGSAKTPELPKRGPPANSSAGPAGAKVAPKIAQSNVSLEPNKSAESRKDHTTSENVSGRKQKRIRPQRHEKNRTGVIAQDDELGAKSEQSKKKLVEEQEKRQKHSALSVILARGENIDIDARKFKLCNAIVGTYGVVEIFDESKVSFYLHYESTYQSLTKGKLKVECLIHVLAAASNRKHIFRLLQRGANTALHIRYFITDAYGPTLSDLQARRPFQKFTVGTATRLAIETLNAIEDLHTVGYVHGDITPTSFVIGRDELENHIYITNFAKVRKFRTKYAKIIPRRSYVPFTSSVRYASRACHDRLECARKDDLESWLFMSVEFYQIRILSWRLLTNLTEIRRRKDIFMSERGANSIKIECVSLPERLPSVVAEILSLRYESMPNYEAIKESFKKHLDTRNYKITTKWDWLPSKSASSGSVKDSVERDAFSPISPVPVDKNRSPEDVPQRRRQDSNLLISNVQISDSLVPRL